MLLIPTYKNFDLNSFKNTMFGISIFLIVNICFAQKTDRIDGNMIFGFGEKTGLTQTEKSYVLTVYYDSNEIKYNISTSQGYSSYSVLTETDGYIVGIDTEGDYCFYSITKKQFYFMINYLKSYISAGYGSGNSEIKQSVSDMMQMLKQGKSESDVIQFLVENN